MAKENELPDSYEYILDKFGEEKLLSRYTWLYDLMENFLRIKNYEDNVIISSDILNHVVIDYFVDIDRLKLFQNIEKTHESKIYAYSAYWLLRHKPMQVVVADQGEKYAFVNEEFVSDLIRSYLFSDPDNIPVLNNKKDVVDNFVGTLLYYFKYREYSAKNIEIMLLAFEAGRGYQYSAVSYTHLTLPTIATV